MKNPLLKYLFVLTMPLFLSFCSEDDDDDATATTLKYADVSTFLTQHCVASKCHSTANKANVGNVDLSTHEGAIAAAVRSAVRIKQTDSPMPPSDSAQFTSFEAETTGKANLTTWFENGAP